MNKSTRYSAMNNGKVRTFSTEAARDAYLAAANAQDAADDKLLSDLAAPVTSYKLTVWDILAITVGLREAINSGMVHEEHGKQLLDNLIASQSITIKLGEW